MTSPGAEDASFQARVVEWAKACFGDAVAGDMLERADRFFEEAAELYQAAAEARRARAATFDPALDGAGEKALALEEARRRAHQLVDYTFARDVGHLGQEMGGVLLTTAALAGAYDLDMHAEGETELCRVLGKIEKIRAKQAAKPSGSALPQTWSDPREARLAALEAFRAQALAVLAPFAALADRYDPADGDDAEPAWDRQGQPRLGELRALRALVQSDPAAAAPGGDPRALSEADLLRAELETARRHAATLEARCEALARELGQPGEMRGVFVMPTTAADYWKAAIGGAYTPAVNKRHVAAHPATIRRIMAGGRDEKTDAIAVLAVNLAMAEHRSTLLLEQEGKRRREMERRVALLERIIDEEGLVVDGDPVLAGHVEPAPALHAAPVVRSGAPAP